MSETISNMDICPVCGKMRFAHANHNLCSPKLDAAQAKRLSEIRERLEKATPGPWVMFGGGGYVSVGVHRVCEITEKIPGASHGPGWNQNSDNYQFIAHAPSDIRYLLEQLEGVEPATTNNKDGGMNCGICGKPLTPQYLDRGKTVYLCQPCEKAKMEKFTAFFSKLEPHNKAGVFSVQNSQSDAAKSDAREWWSHHQDDFVSEVRGAGLDTHSLYDVPAALTAYASQLIAERGHIANAD